MTEPIKSGLNLALSERLDAMLDELAARKGIPHAVLGIASQDGSFSWAGARGSADAAGTPMLTTTPYYLASIDKLFTATTVLRLWERGELDLNSSIGEYLPSSVVTGLHPSASGDRTPKITVRNLLSHTSGLASYLEDRPEGGSSLFQELVEGGDRSWGTEDVADRVRAGLKPHFEPQPTSGKRQRIRYSDTNFALLQAIIERVSGLPLHEAFGAELFRPLQLEETWLAGHPRAGTTPPAALWAGGEPLERPSALRSLNAIYSTLADQHKFLAALVSGRAFSRAETFSEMTSRWNRFGLPFDAAALRAPSWPIQYALGIMRFQVPRFLNGGQPMPELIGHSGSTGTWAFYSPELRLTVVGAVDQAMAGAVPYRFLPKLMSVLARNAR